MFTIETRNIGPLEGTRSYLDYVLTNTDTGEWATVLPAFGGVLRQLVLRKGNIRYKVLDSPASAQALLADETYASALLYPFPSRVRHGIYHFNREDYALPMNETMRDNAIHGFVHGKPFAVVKQETTVEHALVAVQYNYTGDVPGYPFPFALTVTYTLSANGLTLAYEARNRSTVKCPAAFGWHPYFTLNNTPTDDLTLTLPIRATITLNEHMIANGRQPVADDRRGTFSLKDVSLDTPWLAQFTEENGRSEAKTVLSWPANDVSLEITQSDALGYVVVYTPTRRDSIAIEPLTANVDAFNNGEGLTVLQPGETMNGTISVRLR